VGAGGEWREELGYVGVIMKGHRDANDEYLHHNWYIRLLRLLFLATFRHLILNVNVCLRVNNNNNNNNGVSTTSQTEEALQCHKS